MEKGTIEWIKERTRFFLENNLAVFIKDCSNDYYFCNIISMDDLGVIVKGFIGKRKHEKDRILWIDIDEIKEYKEKKKYGSL